MEESKSSTSRTCTIMNNTFTIPCGFELYNIACEKGTVVNLRWMELHHDGEKRIFKMTPVDLEELITQEKINSVIKEITDHAKFVTASVTIDNLNKQPNKVITTGAMEAIHMTEIRKIRRRRSRVFLEFEMPEFFYERFNKKQSFVDVCFVSPVNKFVKHDFVTDTETLETYISSLDKVKKFVAVMKKDGYKLITLNAYIKYCK